MTLDSSRHLDASCQTTQTIQYTEAIDLGESLPNRFGIAAAFEERHVLEPLDRFVTTAQRGCERARVDLTIDSEDQLRRRLGRDGLLI